MVACGACDAHCKLNLLPSSRLCNLTDKRLQFSIISVLLTSTIVYLSMLTHANTLQLS